MAVHWVLACIFTVLALVTSTFRVPSVENVRRTSFSLEAPDAQSGEQDPALRQQGELSRVPGVRPARGPSPSGPSRLAATLLRGRSAATLRLSERGVLHDDSALYVWAPRPKARAELMVFLI